MKTSTPGRNSPKNKLRATITFDKSIKGIGSVISVGAMTLTELKSRAKFYTNQGIKNNINSFVQIFENKENYPKFNWVLKTSYQVKK
jgi:hypothetical protein